MKPTQDSPLAALERKLGGRVTVWIGAIAFALAGVFLVKYSIDQNLVGPEARVVAGLLFGLGLAGAAWKLRERSNYVAQGLAAAAVADVFACLWAAVNLYQMIPPEIGFAAMAATAAAAVLMSRGLGPIVAVVGLIGGYLTPALLPGEAHVALLFGYFLLIQAGTELIARNSRREWLSFLGMGGGAVWVPAYLALRGSPEAALWVAAFTLASFALYGLLSARRPSSDRQVLVWFTGMLASSVAIFAMLENDLSAVSWMLVLGSLAGMVAMARAHAEFTWQVWPAAAMSAIAALLAMQESNVDLATRVVPLFGLVVAWAVAAPLCAVGSRHARHWALAGAIAPALVMLALTVRWDSVIQEYGPYTWMVMLLTLAGLHAAMSGVLLRTRQHPAPLILAAFAVVAVAWPAGLSAHWVTLLWALQLPLMALVAKLLDSEALRAGALVGGLVVFAAFGMNPAILAYDFGGFPTIAWLSIAFAVAAGGFVIARRTLPEGWNAVRGMGACAAAWVGLIGLALHVRYAVTGGELAARSLLTPEIAAYAALALGWCVLMLRGFGRERRLGAGFHTLGEILGFVAVVGTVTVLGIWRNPIIAREAVGGLILFNNLAVIYLLPGLLLVLAAFALRGHAARELQAALGIAGAGMLLVWLVLGIRHLFHGTVLWTGGVSDGEHLSYSLALAAGAVAMLVWGVRDARRGLRLAALALIAVATFKVFLYDASNTEGLYRVLSFVGLGASLMGLGWLYNRFGIAQPVPEPDLPPTEDLLLVSDDRA